MTRVNLSCEYVLSLLIRLAIVTAVPRVLLNDDMNVKALLFRGCHLNIKEERTVRQRRRENGGKGEDEKTTLFYVGFPVPLLHSAKYLNGSDGAMVLPVLQLRRMRIEIG